MKEVNHREGIDMNRENAAAMISEEMIETYSHWLVMQDYIIGTIEKYLRNIKRYAEWVSEEKIVSLENLMRYKKHLMGLAYKPGTANGILSALNTFCHFAGLPVKLNFIKIQKRIFCDEKKELKK